MSARPRAAVLLAVLLAVLIGSSLAVAPADADPYTPAASIAADRSNPCQGGPVTLSGAGYVPGSAVILTVGNTVVGRLVADATGTFRIVITLPAKLAGAQTITATGPSGGRIATTQIMIKSCSNGATDPGGTGTPSYGVAGAVDHAGAGAGAGAGAAGNGGSGGLSSTGVAIVGLLVVAVGLLAGGGVLLLGGRRRRASTA